MSVAVDAPDRPLGPSVHRFLGGARLALLVGTGFLLVRLAMAFTVPLGSSPDEVDHFIKALGASRLDFGDTSDIPVVDDPSDIQLLNQSLTAIIDLDGRPINPTWTCNAAQPDLPATCVDVNNQSYPGRAATTFGAFQPFLYVVIGLPSLVIADPDTSMMAMRLLTVIWTTLFTTFGLVVAARRFGNRGLLASVLGWTPMVLYTQGTLSTSGIEIASAFAAFVSTLDVLSNDGRSTRGARAVLVASCVSLALCRPLSVLVLVVIAALVLMIVGAREARGRLLALPRRYAIVAAAIIVAAVLANVIWSATTPPMRLGPEVGLMQSVGHYLLSSLPFLWTMVIGLFEWLDTDIPIVAVLAAWAAITAVLGWSSAGRDRRSSAQLWFLIVATIGFGFIADYTVFARVGGAVQGRHLLPLFQLWPIVALLPGQLGTSPDRDDGTRLTPLRLGTLVMGVVTAVSWLYIARREAVGINGPLDFFGSAEWHPQFGWKLPMLLLAAGLLIGYLVPVAAGIAHRRIDDPQGGDEQVDEL